IAERQVAVAPLEPLITEDDPALARIREAVQGSSAPDRVLEHSVAVLFHLVGETESEGYPTLLADVLEEAVNDALGQGPLGPALGIVRWLADPERLRPEWQAEPQRRYQLLRRRLAGRSHVTRLVELLRQGDKPDHVRDSAAYLAALGREAMQEFIDILGDEPEGGARSRRLTVVETMGREAEPAIRQSLGDKRWGVVRSMVALLGQMGGDAASLDAVVKIRTHPHPMVRREVARALPTLGGGRVVRWL